MNPGSKCNPQALLSEHALIRGEESGMFQDYPCGLGGQHEHLKLIYICPHVSPEVSHSILLDYFQVRRYQVKL